MNKRKAAACPVVEHFDCSIPAKVSNRVSVVNISGKDFFNTFHFRKTVQPFNAHYCAFVVQDYQAFYEEEMSYRMLLDYPPAAHMLAVLGSGPEDEKLVQAMYYLKLYIERIYRENDLHIIGPAYASVGKVKDIYRQVIYLKHKDHKTLVHIKDQLEKYIEINSGFRKIYIQFDFS